MVTGELVERTVSPVTEQVVAFVQDLAVEHGPVLVTYEAGPTGSGLARALHVAGHACQVAAPSKLLRPVGDRVKTDRRDALLLARLARISTTSPRSRSPRLRRSRHGTWSGPARTPGSR